ncbi:MAG TPA: ATP-binding protein [Micromonosporaceae bacterium]|nr:ATP-binding protein [Micromonosporaceae bacterium]
MLSQAPGSSTPTDPPDGAELVPPNSAPNGQVDGVGGSDVETAAGQAAEVPTTLTQALARMTDAENTLRAIGAGEIDAFVVSVRGTGRHVFTLSTADRPYRMFVENMHDGAATLSSSGIVLYANKRLASMLSYTRDAIVGSPLAQFIDGGPSGVLAQLRDPLGPGSALEMELRAADGSAVPVLVGVSPLDMDDDHLTCLTFTDLSAQKALDREIARLSKAQVERMVDLQDAQAGLTRATEKSRDEAVAQSEVKSHFLATMSHEIRTPMNGVIGLSSLLLRTDLDPTQERYAAGIHTAGNALLGVINDVLDFSKIEADKLVLDVDDFELSAVLTAVTALVNPAAQQKGLTVVTRCDPKLPTMVRGDGGRLRQILLNIVGNAVKFTPRGSVTLRVTQDTSAPGDTGTVRARFEVSDTGIGLDGADAERLFEPFTQADASTTRSYGGTGLGLAICRQLTEAMGGTIGVESAPGQGSTFWCLIPFGQTHSDDPHVEAPSAPDATTLRVLMVDAGLGQTLLQDRLRGWMMTPTAADNAADAVHLLRQAANSGWPFDALIIDAEQVGLDAIGLAQQIISDPRIRTVHIIVLNRDPETDPFAATNGFSCLAKPVDEADLYICLTTIIPSSPPAETPRGIESVGAGSATPQRQRRILLVEDNDINQMVAVGILTGMGYHLTVASDGVEAVELAAANTYDAILMDCRMPRMDGFSATVAVRRSEGAGHRTPIIAMTASALAADREACLAAGMDDYLTKPIKAAELKDALNRWTTDPATEADADPDPSIAPGATVASGQRPTHPSDGGVPRRQY